MKKHQVAALLVATLAVACNPPAPADGGIDADAGHDEADAGSDDGDAGPTPLRVYVAGYDSNQVHVFDLPVTSASAPVANISLVEPWGLCVDADDRVFVVTTTTGDAAMRAFEQPITSASVPAFSFATTHYGEGCEFDPAGNLFVTANWSETEGFEIFSPPFSASTTSVANFADAELDAPIGIAIDEAGHIFTGNLDSITEFDALANDTARIATFAATASDRYQDLVFAPNGDLYVGHGVGIEVYTPALQVDGATAPDHTITPANVTAINALAFDADLNLYVVGTGATLNDNVLLVLAPPYTATAATVTLPAYSSAVVLAP